MQIKAARDAGPGINREISRVFVEGFYPLLRHLCRDKARLARAFEHMFKTEMFYVVLDGGRAAGILACTDGSAQCVSLDKAQLRRHLGFFRGSLAYASMHPQVDFLHYPFPLEEGMGTLENLAVDSAYRGQGIARLLMSYVIDTAPYSAYALEVADNNTAQQFYGRLGFKEVARAPQKFARITGTKANLYMKLHTEAVVK